MSHNYNMYNQNGFHGSQVLMNGGQNHQRYGGMQPKYQQNHTVHQNQIGHQQNHHHNGHYGHQQNLSSGGGGFTPQSHLGNFTHDHAQNGHLENLQHEELEDYGGAQWREQVHIASDIKRGNSPNHIARQMAKDKHSNKTHAFGPQSQVSDSHQDGELNRMTAMDPEAPCQWAELDMGGMGIRSLDLSLFKYTFLQKLHLAHNKLDYLPQTISKLKSLKHLDISYNELTELPEEIGMLTNLETLYMFGNKIQTLPWEMGYLYKLKMLGMVGNPLDEEFASRVRDEDTSSLIQYLRENMPGESTFLRVPYIY
jgi:CCR4-NOT transcription complex subunit 6